MFTAFTTENASGLTGKALKAKAKRRGRSFMLETRIRFRRPPRSFGEVGSPVPHPLIHPLEERT